MGSMGRDLLISEAVQQAGGSPNDTILVNRLTVQLNLWLRARATDAMWPEVVKRGVALSVPAGVQTLTVGKVQGGSPNGGIGDQIHRIFDPAWIYAADFSARGECRIRQITGGTIDDDETINNPSTNIGIPTRCKVRMFNFAPGQAQQRGIWTLVFSPIPDRNYQAAIDYWFIPDNLDTAYGGSAANSLPWYPNDDTMLEFLIARTFYFKGRMQAYQQAASTATSKVADDRMRMVTQTGTDDVNEMDEGIFRVSPPANFPRW